MKEENIIEVEGLEVANDATLEELMPSDIAPQDERDEELKLWKDRYMRQAAEMENYKKRSEREKIDFLRRANEGVMKDFLPVLDNLERALDNPGDLHKDNPFYQGVRMIRDEIDKMLKNNGLEPIETVGRPFNPNQQEAIMQQVDNQAPENTVLMEMQRGYTFQGRVLRPALVVVSKKN